MSKSVRFQSDARNRSCVFALFCASVSPFYSRLSVFTLSQIGQMIGPLTKRLDVFRSDVSDKHGFKDQLFFSIYFFPFFTNNLSLGSSYCLNNKRLSCFFSVLFYFYLENLKIALEEKGG